MLLDMLYADQSKPVNIGLLQTYYTKSSSSAPASTHFLKNPIAVAIDNLAIELGATQHVRGAALVPAVFCP